MRRPRTALTKRNFKRRMPLWMTRLQAKKLLTAMQPMTDFPIILETWRTCLRDEFDLEAAYEVLERIAAGELDWSVASVASPTPFAAGIAFNQIGRYMYADDQPERAGQSALSDDLIRQAVFDQSLRPRLGRAVIRDFEARVQRRAPGYMPDGETELAEWIKERVAIPESEWFDGTPIPAGMARHDGYISHPEVVIGADPVQQTAEMLQFYGPRTVDELQELLPFAGIDAIVAELAGADTLVQDRLVEDDERVYVCDAENLEALIRFQRAASRPAFATRPVADLPAFLADWHQFTRTPVARTPVARTPVARTPAGASAAEAAASSEGAADALDRLRGYAAPVAFWLDDGLVPRLGDNRPERLEAEGARWRGHGTESVVIGLPEDLELLPRPTPSASDSEVALDELFRDPRARYTFNQLLDESGHDSDNFNTAFWHAVWQGRIAADSFQPLAVGRSRSYQFEAAGTARGRRPTPPRPRGAGRTRARAFAASLGWPGTWYRTPEGPAPGDALERLEESKERSRILLDRYGIVTRELANREGGALRWSALFPAFRVMELSGEVVSGLFFDTLSGPQFALPQAVRQLARLRKAEQTFWISAMDPVSPCGLGPGPNGVPHRRLGNHLGYYEGELAVVSESYARRLRIALDVDDPGLDALLVNLKRLCSARRRLVAETINDEPARSSPYLAALARHLATVTDHKGVYLESRY